VKQQKNFFSKLSKKFKGYAHKKGMIIVSCALLIVVAIVAIILNGPIKSIAHDEDGSKDMEQYDISEDVEETESEEEVEELIEKQQEELSEEKQQGNLNLESKEYSDTKLTSPNSMYPIFTAIAAFTANGKADGYSLNKSEFYYGAIPWIASKVHDDLNLYKKSGSKIELTLDEITNLYNVSFEGRPFSHEEYVASKNSQYISYNDSTKKYTVKYVDVSAYDVKNVTAKTNYNDYIISCDLYKNNKKVDEAHFYAKDNRSIYSGKDALFNYTIRLVTVKSSQSSDF